MKNTKKLFIFVLSIVMVLSFAGCAFSAAILPVTLENGDSFNIKMKSDSQMLSLTYDKDKDDLLKLCDSDENEVLVGAFLDDDSFEDYVETLISSYEDGLSNIKFLDAGEHNGIEYVLISFKNPSEEKTYEIVGWIVGSNTGVLLDGSESKSETVKLFKSLTFKISETEQTKSKYVNDALDDLKDFVD